MKDIGILIFSQVEELDFVGPLEVFDLVNRYVQNGASVFTFSSQGGEVVGAHGLKMIPSYSFDDIPRLDILVVPGGRGAREQMSNPKVLEFIASQARDCELVTSVCTGALILAAADLLRGRRATTHGAALEELGNFEGVQVVRERYVHDGEVITAAGVSAGIDMALYVIGLLFGETTKQSVAREMEYG